ncbi:MAG: alpha/beta hydrolase [Ktedonobacteraceae bacterium]|nr:alpha/beta hydrolase [Ktedonobacteraceae bacterium]
MYTFWSRHPWLRRCIFGMLAFLVVVISALLALAYLYMPPEERTETPTYLTYLQARHLDGYVDAGDFRLHYLHEGKGAPVVLLPGNGAWIYSFRDIVPTLAQHYSVYAIDTPGDGYTTPLLPHPDYATLYTLTPIDQSILAFLDHFHPGRVAIGGNSEGGGIALSFAEHYPERVSKYLSLDGTGLNIPDSWFWQLTAAPVIGEVYTKLTISRDAMRQILSAVTVHLQVTDAVVENYYIPYTFHLNVVSWWVMECRIHWEETEQQLAQMNIPILVIWGKQDTVLDPQLYLPRWRHVAPQATIVEIDQAGYAVQEDQPEQVSQTLLHFLAS